MTASPYPHLFATLGDAATRPPDDLARTLEDTFVALQTGNNPGAITLQACLQYIRQGGAADGQPWPGTNGTPGQRLALARIDRANAGLSFLLELLHATERVRVDGDIDQHMDDGAREGPAAGLPWAGRVCGCAVAGGMTTRNRSPLNRRAR